VTAVVDEYQAQTQGLAARTEAAVLGLYGQLTAGEIDTDTTIPLIAAVVNRANAAAVALADAWLAVQIETQARQPVPVVGVLPEDGSDRLMKGVTTILFDIVEDAVTRLARMARAEPLESSCWGTHEAMQEQPLVEGWVRQTDSDPCQLCQWWSRNGRVWPKDHRMPTHKGCNCQPRIVLVRDIKPVEPWRRRKNG
jgi:hypothetical protein